MSTTYAPHITSPKGGESFNRSQVLITWNKNNPPTEDEYGAISTPSIVYEIEYTDKYDNDQTVWSSLKRRISGTESSYLWIVGKMIKSDKVRIRIRARLTSDGSVSDWSMISGNFSINVFKLIPPAIVNPLPNYIYTDFILVILDETLTRETYSQKIRYTLDYSSKKQNIDWTRIQSNLPFGQNVIRWNIEGLLPSDDYILRLTVKNSSTSCQQNEPPQPDQVTHRFVYNITIQQPGMFIIDTKPPQAVLDVENVFAVTNELNQTINVFAEDATTDISQIQIRECNSSNELALGNIDNPIIGTTDCESIESLVAGENVDFDRVLSKPQGYSSKILWTFDDVSGIRKLEAMLTDYGGNTSLQEKSKTFLPVFKSDVKIYDFIIAQEQREQVTITQDPEGNVVVNTEAATYEVAYIATLGQYWILEPFPRMLFQSSVDREIRKLFLYNDVMYVFTYANNDSVTDEGIVFRDDKTQTVAIYEFTSPLSITNSVAQFETEMYIGLENGELHSYNGSSFTLVETFSDPILSLAGDSQYLYIGFSNSANITLYNGSEFFSMEQE